MSSERSIFYDSWRACLREHYLHTIRSGDTVTEPSLREILEETGFSVEDIEKLSQQGQAQIVAGESPTAIEDSG